MAEISKAELLATGPDNKLQHFEFDIDTSMVGGDIQNSCSGKNLEQLRSAG